jgi:hypothetical protein
MQNDFQSDLRSIMKPRNYFLVGILAIFSLMISSAQTVTWQDWKVDAGSVSLEVLGKALGCANKESLPELYTTGYFTQTVFLEAVVFAQCKKNSGFYLLQHQKNWQLVWKSKFSDSLAGGGHHCGRAVRRAGKRDLLICTLDRYAGEGWLTEINMLDFVTPTVPVEQLLLELPDNNWVNMGCGDLGIFSVAQKIETRAGWLRITVESAKGLAAITVDGCRVFGDPSQNPRTDQLEFTWQDTRGFELTAQSRALRLELADRISYANGDTPIPMADPVKGRVLTQLELDSVSAVIPCQDPRDENKLYEYMVGRFTNAFSNEALLDHRCANSSNAVLVRLVNKQWRVVHTWADSLSLDSCEPLWVAYVQRDLVVCRSDNYGLVSVLDFKNPKKPRNVLKLVQDNTKISKCLLEHLPSAETNLLSGFLKMTFKPVRKNLSKKCGWKDQSTELNLEFRWNDARGFHATPQTKLVLATLADYLKFSN